MEEKKIGKVVHYYTHLGVAIVEVSEDVLRVGDMIHVKGKTTDLQQPVESIQIEHQQVSEATPGQTVGVKVTEHVRENDMIYRVIS